MRFSVYPRRKRAAPPPAPCVSCRFLTPPPHTQPDARQGLVDSFNLGHGQVFLLSTRAGGVGLNLVGANVGGDVKIPKRLKLKKTNKLTVQTIRGPRNVVEGSKGTESAASLPCGSLLFALGASLAPGRCNVRIESPSVTYQTRASQC